MSMFKLKTMILWLICGIIYLLTTFYLNYILFTVMKQNENCINVTNSSEKQAVNISKKGLYFESKICMKHPLFFGGTPPNLTLEVPSWEEIEKSTRHVQIGGRFEPNCTNPYKVAIIIPYRNREDHLKIFLKYIHSFLQYQNLQYGIFVIELDSELTFNRGLLLNIGYLEATKRDNYECFIFHDVDHLPELSFNLYNCQKFPTHMASAVDRFEYKVPYDTMFGGVSSFRKDHFEKVNGFSNLYFGWGGEDDDLWERVHATGMKVTRTPLKIGRYTMIPHKRDVLNEKNYFRYKLLENAVIRMQMDGLNSVKYKTINIEKSTYYTKLIVRIFRNEYDEMFFIKCKCKN